MGFGRIRRKCSVVTIKSKAKRMLGWGAVAVAACIAMALALRFISERADEGGHDPPESIDLDLSAGGMTRKAPSAEAWGVGRSYPAPRDALALMPQEVINAAGCAMRMGKGQASDLAVVVVPAAGGARFSVLDDAGQVFGGSLPFLPNHQKIGKNASGAVVAGFGDLRLNQRGNRGDETAEPVRIFLDGRLIYEHDKLWWFGVASDGSSYSALEPLGGGQSQLLIHNLDEGKRISHYLGDRYDVSNAELPYGLAYSADNRELHLSPSYSGDSAGMGAHYFYSTTDAENVRKIRVQQRSFSSVDVARFYSSEAGYFVYGRDPEESGELPDMVVRREFNWDDGTAKDTWARAVEAWISPHSVRVFGDGEWLMFKTAPRNPMESGNDRAYRLWVLDGRSAKVLIDFPTAATAEQLARLADVMHPQATVTDIGAIKGATMLENKLLVARELLAPANSVVSELVYDVFSLGGPGAAGKPELRVAVNRTPDNLCASFDFPRTLSVIDGTLTFAPSHHFQALARPVGP